MSTICIRPIAEYRDYPEELLEPVRRSKIAACKVEAKKEELRAAGALLRETLAADGYELQGPIELEYQCYGKPYLVDQARYFSLSHSGEYVACVVDCQEVGIDIEKIQPVNRRVAERILNEDEYRAFDEKTEEEKDEELIRLWTRKESVAKCLGGGIFRNPKELPMEQFEIKTERFREYYVSTATQKASGEANEK